MTLILHAELSLERGTAGYPAALALLGDAAPEALSGCGALAALRRPLTALFSSVAVPGEAMLAAYDLARAIRDAGVPVVGGFQAPVERGCLDFLLRGSQPVVVCPARGVEGMRAPAAWRRPIEEGRLLVLSPFPAARRRASAGMADVRNRLVAALAERILVVHAVPGGRLHRLVAEALRGKKRVLCPDLPANRELVVMGAEPIDPSIVAF
jgi:predicted Rossmann fold nucleotide-binding protein DprA/Smf involved in DNA uptake